LLAKPQFQTLPPLALYIHFPWCIQKCPYCDFNSHTLKTSLDEAHYVDALLHDLDTVLPSVWGRPLTSIFMGGGTPSLFSAQAIDEVLAGVRARLKCLPEMEITLEANPGTFEKDKFAGYKAAGVNRLSLGIQSFNEAHLKALGRVHDRAQAIAAAEHSLTIFERVNLDLMYGLPSQSLAELQADLSTALAFGAEHLSYYNLTLEPNTQFAANPPSLPDDDSIADMQQLIEDTTAQQGFQHYEISAYCQPDKHSRHNRNYWEFGDYIGIGAGAHSKISAPNSITRQMRYKQPAHYLKQIALGEPCQSNESINRQAVGFEFMLNALRLTDGFAVNLFSERTGFPLSLIEAPLQQAEQKGLLLRDHLRIKASPLGQQFLNDLQGLFLP
jgi:putative oxygen-independent coproporphyrinogen III oxidase